MGATQTVVENKSGILGFMPRSKMPNVGGRGTNGALKVAISPNGQIRFSSAISKAIGDKLLGGLTSFDLATGKAEMTFGAKPFVSGVNDPVDYIGLKVSGKEGNGKQYFASFSRELAAAKEAGYGYDYKASGNQIFPAEMVTDSKKDLVKVKFALPKGSLTAKPTVLRPRKPKTDVTPIAQASQKAPEVDLTAPE